MGKREPGRIDQERRADLRAARSARERVQAAPASDATPIPSAGRGLDAAAHSYRALFQGQNLANAEQLDSWCASFAGDPAHAALFRDMGRSDPQAALQLAEGLTTLPDAGTEFLDFRLLAELGRGTFGRVYLARQGDLANRLVALKVAGDIGTESRALAQLQHTHIVPIYSCHKAGPLQAVCMPYFGATTLADVVRDLGRRDSLPQSGKGLVSTLVERRKKAGPTANGGGAAPANVSALTPGAETPTTLRWLEGLTYVEAVLWLMARVADGLAHAHERAVLHRDLKPANILLTDDGQPMLLDFNLSEDAHLRSSAAVALIGGTLPYMAPEHLAAFAGMAHEVDARSDVYSLGVILYELLTGRRPFDRYPGPVASVLPLLIAERLGPPPALRPWNAAISPAVESLVQHCLAPYRDGRYQTARQLRDDLERQLRHEPLRYAPEASWRERAIKWRRRHPRLAPFSVAAAAVVLCIAAGTLSHVRGRELAQRGAEVARLQATEAHNAFREEHKAAQLLLNARGGDRAQWDEGRSIALRALGRYRVLDQPAWQETPAYRQLSAENQDQLRGDIGELLLLLAGAAALRAPTQGVEPAGSEALRLNELAETCYPGERTPRALWTQRAELVRLLGRGDEARLLQSKAERVPLRDGWDHYLLARERALRGRFAEALPDLLISVRRDPRNFGAWFLLGNCCLDGFGQEGEAVAHYTTCIALCPDFHAAHFNRGLAQLRRREYEAAGLDFSRAIELRPEHGESLVHRALARQGMKDYRAAENDLTQALEFQTPSTRIYFMRSRIRQFLGDSAGAKHDLDEGLKRAPNDEESWIARGIARVGSDPQGALHDFVEAVKLNPRSLAGLQNQAHVLSEKLGRNEEAIQKLDAVLDLYPDFAPARGGRGVLRARLEQREAALRDASDTLLRDTQPPTLYQVAGIYAHLSPDHPEDAREALRLLSSALQQGYGLDLIDRDSDLDPLREDARFRELLKAAQALRTKREPAR